MRLVLADGQSVATAEGEMVLGPMKIIHSIGLGSLVAPYIGCRVLRTKHSQTQASICKLYLPHGPSELGSGARSSETPLAWVVPGMQNWRQSKLGSSGLDNCS